MIWRRNPLGTLLVLTTMIIVIAAVGIESDETSIRGTSVESNDGSPYDDQLTESRGLNGNIIAPQNSQHSSKKVEKKQKGQRSAVKIITAKPNDGKVAAESEGVTMIDGLIDQTPGNASARAVNVCQGKKIQDPCVSAEVRRENAATEHSTRAINWLVKDLQLPARKPLVPRVNLVTQIFTNVLLSPAVLSVLQSANNSGRTKSDYSSSKLPPQYVPVFSTHFANANT